MGRRVEDGGKSECRPITGRIGVEFPRRDHPTRKRADFPQVFRHERTLANRLRGSQHSSGRHWETLRSATSANNIRSRDVCPQRRVGSWMDSALT